ncbi:MAG: DUF2304 family protein [Patescibacteria group bacterium]|nr:DUF2304 family protein [Patescibacteria group bacterium]
MLALYQIFIPLLCLAMIIGNWTRHRTGELNRRGFIIWSLIWLFLGIFALFPETSSMVARVTGIKNSFSALTVTAFLVLFYLVFHGFRRMERMNRELTKIVRNHALLDIKNPGKRNKARAYSPESPKTSKHASK